LRAARVLRQGGGRGWQIAGYHGRSIAQVLESCKGRSFRGLGTGVSAEKAGGLHARRYIMTRK
jgi:hypothetical protein